MGNKYADMKGKKSDLKIISSQINITVTLYFL